MSLTRMGICRKGNQLHSPDERVLLLHANNLQDNFNLCRCGQYINLFFFFLIYLAVSGLCCGTRDLCHSVWDLSLRRAGFSLVVA